MLTMEELGYFIYMDEQEKKQQQPIEETSENENSKEEGDSRHPPKSV